MQAALEEISPSHNEIDQYSDLHNRSSLKLLNGFQKSSRGSITKKDLLEMKVCKRSYFCDNRDDDVRTIARLKIKKNENKSPQRPSENKSAISSKFKSNQS